MTITVPMRSFRFVLLLSLLCATALPARAQGDDEQFDVVIVMTRESGLSTQLMIAYTDVPWNDIRARYRNEFMATELSGSDNGWVVVISQGSPHRGQVLDGTPAALALRSKIDEAQKLGQVTTNIEYGGGKWVLTYSTPLWPQKQIVLGGAAFPKAEVERYINQGWSVVTLDHGGAVGAEEWIVVLSDKSEWTGQKILTGDEFPLKDVEKELARGYRVTTLDRGGGRDWAVVLSKGTGWGEQHILHGKSYPTQSVDSAWKRGYAITSLAWDPPPGLPTLAFNNEEIESHLEEVANLGTGLWYDAFVQNNPGTELGFVAVQRMAGYYVAQRQWTQAVETYERYRSLFPTMGKRFDKIISILQQTDTAIIFNIGPNINTMAGEFMPLVSADDQSLFFTGMTRSGGQGGEDIFLSERSGEGWGPAANLRGFVNTANHEFGTSISADGNQLVLFASRADGLGSGDLYFANKARGGFGSLMPYPKPINSTFWDCDGALTSDGKAMLFATDRPGAVGPYQKKDVLYRGERWGNVDIWVSVRNDTGWGEPINLGETINTSWAERSPYLHPDGKTLYFCSSGHPGLGKLDVFVSTRLKEDSWTEWSEPINLGKAINGVGSDWGYRVNTNGTYAYFAAEGLPGNRGGSDIYVQELPQAMRPQQVATVRGVVTDTEGRPLAATIKWEDLSTGKEVGELSSDEETGKYFITLPLGKNYGYYAEKDDYYPVTKSIDLRRTSEGVDVEVNITMMPIEKIAEEGTSVRLNNIFFDVDKASLRPESEAELDRFAGLLVRFPNEVIEISGHTDSTASATYNQNLSQRRAQSVVDYLITRGIPAKNLVAKGYGEEKPVADNGLEEGRSLNRRVEFRFLKKEEKAALGR